MIITDSPFTYDSKGRLQSYDNCPQVIYDNRNNVVSLVSSTPSFSADFTYDNNLNPLFFVHNLFAIFVEEHFIWEYKLSEHNSVTKSYLAGDKVTYNNVYNSRKQLTEKTFYDNNEGGDNIVSFTYYNF